MRWALLLVMSAGCDSVFGLRTFGHDAPLATRDAPARDTATPDTGPLPSSCRDAMTRGVVSDGVLTIDTDGPGPKAPFDVYCDMTTAGGGWTLVWSYGFTDYPAFMNNNNAVTPIPSWSLQVNQPTPTSTTTPTSPTVAGALDFPRWQDIGSEILVTSTINHWIQCAPGTGSLVTLTPGSISCQVVRVVATVCPTVAPNAYFSGRDGPVLGVGTTGASYYYYFDGSTGEQWPSHDPCGTSGTNQLPGVANPGGAVYVR